VFYLVDNNAEGEILSMFGQETGSGETAVPAWQPDRYTQTNASYADLKKRVKEQDLLDKQPAYVIRRAILNLFMFAISITLLVLTDNIWIQIGNAFFMGFVFVQFGFIAHDVGHRQAFRKPETNNQLGLIHAPLLIGMSFGWWMDKHNEHHSHPNVQDLDPDIDFPFIASANRMR
jgi:fatty acid desaturase